MKLDKPKHMPGDVLEDGSLYVGVVDGYHLSIEPNDEPKKMTWHEAIKILGCPTSRELNLISANVKALGLDKNEGWYWSSTEYNNNYAWIERFSDGYQDIFTKFNTYFVRCVRRYSVIQSFNHLLPEIIALKKRLEEIEEEIGK